jgi:hypothetical protein
VRFKEVNDFGRIKRELFMNSAIFKIGEGKVIIEN